MSRVAHNVVLSPGDMIYHATRSGVKKYEFVKCAHPRLTLKLPSKRAIKEYDFSYYDPLYTIEKEANIKIKELTRNYAIRIFESSLRYVCANFTKYEKSEFPGYCSKVTDTLNRMRHIILNDVPNFKL